MRRKDREITDTAIIESILQEALVCRLGLSDKGQPYVVPVNFGYRDNCLFIHCANEGRKLDIIKKNNRVCFEVDIAHEIIRGETPCTWAFKYKSVIGFGTAHIISDAEEKRKGLDVIMQKYSGEPGEFVYPEGSLDRVTIIKVEIETMTGKQSGYLS